jgi:hypothetical protein
MFRIRERFFIMQGFDIRPQIYQNPVRFKGLKQSISKCLKGIKQL